MEFRCVEDCSQCCIEREYYPSKKFGKIGVLIFPEEKEKMENLAKNLDINITILPRIGVSDDSGKSRVLAYQLMGKEKNGNTCPFLDTESGKKSPHGGYPCKIYQNRPLACRAYPVIDTKPVTLDPKCKFCQECGNTDKNLDSELEALIKIQNKMKTRSESIWRYATGIGEKDDKNKIDSGWFLDS